jgi:hypothetical protein
MKTKDKTVEDWVLVIKLAIEKDSPFKGMVDLRDIFKLPLETQYEIYDALSPAERDRLKDIYGPKKGDGV